MPDRYYLTENRSPEREVSAEEWLAAERAAGFVPKPTCGPFATGGFGKTYPDGSGIHGRIESDPGGWSEELREALELTKDADHSFGMSAYDGPALDPIDLFRRDR